MPAIECSSEGGREEGSAWDSISWLLFSLQDLQNTHYILGCTLGCGGPHLHGRCKLRVNSSGAKVVALLNVMQGKVSYSGSFGVCVGPGAQRSLPRGVAPQLSAEEQAGVAWQRKEAACPHLCQTLEEVGVVQTLEGYMKDLKTHYKGLGYN